ncbi:MAG: DUF222 domain-containing protein [Granulosicoccus sp.]
MYDAPTGAQTQNQHGSKQVQETARIEAFNNTDLAPTFGMSSFNSADQQAFGHSLRVAMALIQGNATDIPLPGKAMPEDPTAIERRLRTLNRDITSSLADLVVLLVRFDDLKGWQHDGARHCAAWIDTELGISRKRGWEYLRVGRSLRSLPVITALFRIGQLTWSKVRLLTRVANEENESLLCHWALDASVSELEKLCNERRWHQHDDDDIRQIENDRALLQWESRSLRWNTANNGNTVISLSLPPQLAQAFLNSVEHSLEQLELSEATIAQRRADAAVLMAENSLQNASTDVAAADRYQVIVSIDAAELRNDANAHIDDNAQNTDNVRNTSSTHKKSNAHKSGIQLPALPARLARLTSAISTENSSLGKDTARRLACDCSSSAIINENGGTVNIGRKTRIWPAAMARAIKVRDQQCVFPGCTQTRHLQIHHIVHWADGGSTSVDNGVCLCTHHHILLHEGGYRIERVAGNQKRLDEQFEQQTTGANSQAIHIERQLRNSRESFDAVRQCSPERFRFRVVDSSGNNVAHKKQSPRGDCEYKHKDQSTTLSHDSSVAESSTSYYCKLASRSFSPILAIANTSL